MLSDHPVILVRTRGRPAHQIHGVVMDHGAGAVPVNGGLPVCPPRHPLPVLIMIVNEINFMFILNEIGITLWQYNAPYPVPPKYTDPLIQMMVRSLHVTATWKLLSCPMGSGGGISGP